MSATDPRHQALDIGNRVKRERTALRREIADLDAADGLERLATLVLEVPDCLRSMVLYEFLSWPRGMGASSPSKVHQVDRFWLELDDPPWGYGRTVGRLTVRQRTRVAELLHVWAGRVVERRH